MAIGNMYVLDLHQAFNGKPLHNIFTYEGTGSMSAFALCQAFIDQVLTARLRPIQCSQINSVSVSAYNLGVPEDIFEITVGANGGITAEMLPVFNAINFTFKSGSRGIRPGSKRIAGVPETVQVDGTITDGAYITALNALRVQFGEDLDGGDTDVYTPVIIKRVKYLPEDNPPDKFAYRFPETDAELVFAEFLNVLLNTKVSSQVSRK